MSRAVKISFVLLQPDTYTFVSTTRQHPVFISIMPLGSSVSRPPAGSYDVAPRHPPAPPMQPMIASQPAIEINDDESGFMLA